MTSSWTQNLLDSLETPPKRLTLHDPALPGHTLQVSPTGLKTFYVYKKYNGRPVRVRIGAMPAVSLSQARTIAVGILNQMASRSLQEARGDIKLSSLYPALDREVFRAHTRSWADYERVYKTHLAPFHHLKLSSIKRQDVVAQHAAIGRKAGPYAANKALRLLTCIFNRARDRGYTGPNPCVGVRKFREESRERYLTAEEMPRFLDAVESSKNADIRDFVLLALLTGARKRNVLEMRWEEVNFEAGSWRIPQTKNGSPQVVPLSTRALTVLNARSRVNEFVFPGRYGKGCLQSPAKGWKAILSSAGISGLRIHDLRRSLGSWQAALGASELIIGKSLGHRSPASTRVYARLDVEPVRRSVEAAADAMFTFRERSSRPRERRQALQRLHQRQRGRRVARLR